MNKTTTLDDLFNEEESILKRRARERREREEAFLATPEGKAAAERESAARIARRDAEHAKGVRLGWWDEEGNSLIADEPDEDEDEDKE